MTYAVLFKINNILPLWVTFYMQSSIDNLLVAVLYRMAEHLS